MPELSDYMQSLTLGTTVSNITGKSMDGFVAGGFSTFVQALTGKVPAVTRMPGNKAQVVLTKEQAMIMRGWLDAQIKSAMTKSKDSTLDIQMGPVLLPWAMKYIVPAALVFVAVGWMANHYWGR